MSVCLCVAKDLFDRRPDIVVFFSEASHRSRNYFGGGYLLHPTKRIWRYPFRNIFFYFEKFYTPPSLPPRQNYGSIENNYFRLG